MNHHHHQQQQQHLAAHNQHHIFQMQSSAEAQAASFGAAAAEHHSQQVQQQSGSNLQSGAGSPIGSATGASQTLGESLSVTNRVALSPTPTPFSNNSKRKRDAQSVSN